MTKCLGRYSLLLIIILLGSCASKKKIVYFQDSASSTISETEYEATLQPDDLLLIIVSAPEPEAAVPYNLITYTSTDTGSDRTGAGVRYQTYLVDSEGEIEFPVLGTIRLGGLTKGQAVDHIKEKLQKYIYSPIVNLRIVNYKFSVLGEVLRPGSYNIETERITLTEALSMAGDLTIYGSRKDVLIIRDNAGVKSYNYVDLTSADFMNSPFYYLDQNDVVYVQPNQTRVNSSAVGPNLTIAISAISLLVTVFALITR